jgi:phosphinothricin acetyltransferase
VIAIRPARADDAAAIAAIYAPHVLAGVVSFETEAPDARGIEARKAGADGLYPWIVATRVDEFGGEMDGEIGPEIGGILGYAYASRFREREAYRWVVETTVYVANVAQRAGVGRLLYQSLTGTLRAQGFTQAIGVIALPNDGSVRLHEAVGFRRAGMFRDVGYKHGRWVDVGYWQCELAEPAVPPAEPKRFAEIGVVRE